MVGVFSRFSAFLDKKGSGVTTRQKEGVTKPYGEVGRFNGDQREANDDEFKAIEHPAEPSDDDYPAEWPILDSCIPNYDKVLKEFKNLQHHGKQQEFEGSTSQAFQYQVEFSS